MPTSSVSVYRRVKVKSVCLSQSSFPLDPRAERDIFCKIINIFTVTFDLF